MTRKLQVLFVICALLLPGYVGSYLVLSRRAFAEADRYGLKGLHFAFPVDEQADRINDILIAGYYPCIVIDCWIGTGREPGGVPMRGLSK